MNTLYTDTQYNNKIRYNHGNLTGTKPSPKRWQLINNTSKDTNILEIY